MSLIAISAVLFFASCVWFVAGVVLRIGYAARNRGFQSRLNLLVLTLVIASLFSTFNAEAIRADAPDVTDRVHVLSIRTAIGSFGPSILGLHAYFGAPPSGRVFISSVGTRGFPTSRMYQRHPMGHVPYPVLWHHGQPVGLDRWFSDAITSVKASFVLIC